MPTVSQTPFTQTAQPSTLLVPTRLQSLPAGAHAGGSYVLRGAVANEGTKAGGSALLTVT